MKKLFLVSNYISYWLKATNEHGVHSPFVFDLITQVLYTDTRYYAYSTIEELRNELLGSKQKVECVDLGAGSLIGDTSKNTVSGLANNAAKPPKYSQLLFRLVNRFQPEVMLELGTSLGISGAYLASANSNSKLITIEGCPEIAVIALQNFAKLELKNVELLTGNFDDLLPQVLKKVEKLDFAFFDGNHRKAPTLNYFEQCLAKSTEQSVFIFDDIYWSAEMKQAWQEIKNHNRVTVTIDLFYFGIVFFRKEQEKQHFVIKF